MARKRQNEQADDEDRSKPPQRLYPASMDRVFLDVTGREWSFREGLGRYRYDPNDTTLVAALWAVVDEERDKLRSQCTCPFVDFALWTEYRKASRPMGNVPLSVLTDAGRTIRTRLVDPDTGLVGRSNDYAGASKEAVFWTWKLKYERKESYRYVNRPDGRQDYVRTKPRKGHEPHPSYGWSLSDFQIIRDKLLDEGLCSDASVQLNPRGDQVKMIFRS